MSQSGSTTCALTARSYNKRAGAEMCHGSGLHTRKMTVLEYVICLRAFIFGC